MLKNKLEHLKDESILSYQLLVLSMLYAVSRVIYKALFLKKFAVTLLYVNNSIVISYSDFILPALFIISNLIVIIAGKRLGILIIFFGILCEGIFSLSLGYISLLPIPTFMSHTETLTTNTVNLMGNYMWLRYTQNILTSISIAIIEVIIFSALFKALKGLIFATIISVFSSIILLNIINHNYHNFAQFIFNNCILTATILSFYTLILFGVNQTFTFYKL